MSGRTKVLDTSAIVAYLRGASVAAGRLDSRDKLVVPAIAVGELRYGTLLSSQPVANLRVLEAFLDRTTVADCTAATARSYSEIRAQLKRDGHPIPDNDIWIAASALEYHGTLLSTDKHFNWVKGLKHEHWTS